MQPKESQVTFRLPSELLERAEKLTEAFNRDPDNAAMGVNRAMVLRLALTRGIEALEGEKGRRKK